jgi:hypothetical protein
MLLQICTCALVVLDVYVRPAELAVHGTVASLTVYAVDDFLV